MSPRNEDKAIAVKLSELFIQRLDTLARNGSFNRHQLMLTLVTVWLGVLNESGHATLFDLALLLREKIKAARDMVETAWEYTESHFQEKSIPIKLPDVSILEITCLVSRTRMTRHQIMKNMVVVGMEELEILSNNNPYNYSEIESKFIKRLQEIMSTAIKLFNRRDAKTRKTSRNRSGCRYRFLSLLRRNCLRQRHNGGQAVQWQ